MLLKACNKYLAVLAHDQTNAYACIGLANVLAIFNKTEDAVEIFKLLTQIGAGNYVPLMNQAHLNIGQNKFEVAINLYKIVLEKYKVGDLKTGMYLAKAYFRKQEFHNCKTLLFGLITRFPQHIPLKFDLALCLYEQAEKIFQAENRRAFQTREAILFIKHSLKLFSWVQKQFKNQFKFSRTLDLNQKNKNSEVMLAQYKDLQSICDIKIGIIMDMLQYSEA